MLLLPMAASAATLRTPPNNLGLVGYWSFEDGSGSVATDFSGNGNDGTLQGDPQWTSGRLGTALDFDGSDDYVETNSELSALRSKATLTFWIKTSQSTDNGSAWEQPGVTGIEIGGGDDDIFWGIIDPNGHIGIQKGNGNYIDTTSAINDNEWHFIALFWDATTGEAKVYRDGNLDASGTTDSGTVTNTFRSIGRVENTEATPDFNGKIDEVRIYNRALAASEVRDLYQSGLSKVNTSRQLEDITGLQGWWTFDGQHIGDTIEDSSINNGNGYFIGGATSSAKTRGRLGQALQFDGVDDWASIDVDISLMGDSDEKTHSLWFYPHDVQSRQVLWEQGGSTNGVNLYLDGGTLYTRAWSGTKGWSNDLQVSTSISANEWYHVALSLDATGDSMTSYLNGASIGTDTKTDGSQLNYQGADDAGVGAQNNSTRYHDGNDGTSGSSHFFDGVIDDPRQYDRALSADEIQRIYNATRPSHVNTSQNDRLTDGLVGMWSFDGPDIDWSTNTATDASGNGNDGTINGAKAGIGKIGQALEFDGVDDYVEDSDAENYLNNLTELTVSVWVQSNVIGTDNGIIYAKTPDGSDTILSLRYDDAGADGGGDDVIKVGIGGDLNESTSRYESANNVQTTEWQHLVVTWKGNEAPVLYIDGEKDSPTFTDSQGSSISDVTTLLIGRGAKYTNPGGWDGSIDNVRIYNRALSEQEVKQLYRLGR